MGTYLLDDRDRIGNSYLLISNAINASGPFPGLPFPFPARLPCGLFPSLSIFACISVPSPCALFPSVSSVAYKHVLFPYEGPHGFALRSASACFSLALRSASNCFSRSAFAFNRARSSSACFLRSSSCSFAFCSRNSLSAFC